MFFYRITTSMWTTPAVTLRRAPFAPHLSKTRRMEVKQTLCSSPMKCWASMQENLPSYPCRRASRKSYYFQCEPLQSPFAPAAEIPQVFTSCQRGEQDKEGAGGPAAAGTRGKEGSLFFFFQTHLNSFLSIQRQSKFIFAFALKHFFLTSKLY